MPAAHNVCADLKFHSRFYIIFNMLPSYFAVDTDLLASCVINQFIIQLNE